MGPTSYEAEKRERLISGNSEGLDTNPDLKTEEHGMTNSLDADKSKQLSEKQVKSKAMTRKKLTTQDSLAADVRKQKFAQNKLLSSGNLLYGGSQGDFKAL